MTRVNRGVSITYLSQNKDNKDGSQQAKATSCSEIVIVCLEGHFSMTLFLRWGTSEVILVGLKTRDCTLQTPVVYQSLYLFPTTAY